MKKIFPLIVVLITLSVVGILLIQMSWISNSLRLKHQEFEREEENALKQTRLIIQDKFITKSQTIILNEESKQFYLQNNFKVDGTFTRDEIHDIIDKQLRQNNIKEPFEFCITNDFPAGHFAVGRFPDRTHCKKYGITA